MIDHSIDLTIDSIFIRKNKDNYETTPESRPKIILSISKDDNEILDNILLRKDCVYLNDYFNIIENLNLSIEDLYEIYREGYFCDSCGINIYKTNNKFECYTCKITSYIYGG